MNNQLVMENYLLVLKSSVEVYVHGTLESSNKDVRDLLKECLNEIMTSQADTYILMTRNNWYTIDNVKTNKICELIKKLNKKE